MDKLDVDSCGKTVPCPRSPPQFIPVTGPPPPGQAAERGMAPQDGSDRIHLGSRKRIRRNPDCPGHVRRDASLRCPDRSAAAQRPAQRGPRGPRQEPCFALIEIDAPVIEPSEGRHDRKAFCCGLPELDRHLARQASQDVRLAGHARTGWSGGGAARTTRTGAQDQCGSPHFGKLDDSPRSRPDFTGAGTLFGSA